ncbi:MAG: TlpA disulfide reductase family protein [Chitinophagaceae bacterium]
MIKINSGKSKLLIAAGFLSSLFFITSCFNTNHSLRNGVWRATLQRADGQQVVFNFQVADSSGKEVIYIFNANERMKVDSILFKGDSVFIQMPFFGSHFNAKINTDGSLQGTWTKNYGNRLAVMPFHAVPGDSSRLTAYGKAERNISGSWAAYFPGRRNDTFRAIGLFQQNGNQLTGTFMTPSGDYRYLQGVVSGDTMKLSGFDGCHALLFTALIDADSSISNGKLYSINSPVDPWYAEKKVFDSLPSAYSVDNIKPGTVKLGFHLKNMLTGKEISLADSNYLGKVVVIQILGSWCPNCMDETKFLAQYYKENHQRGVDFIGVDFERTSDFQKSKQAMQTFFDHFDISYPILFSGVAASDPDLTEKVFPNLPVKIQDFPTTIFIDKQGYVRKIHNGINGPATGKYYDQFKNEFKDIVNGLLAE